MSRIISESTIGACGSVVVRRKRSDRLAYSGWCKPTRKRHLALRTFTFDALTQCYWLIKESLGNTELHAGGAEEQSLLAVVVRDVRYSTTMVCICTILDFWCYLRHQNASLMLIRSHSARTVRTNRLRVAFQEDTKEPATSSSSTLFHHQTTVVWIF